MGKSTWYKDKIKNTEDEDGLPRSKSSGIKKKIEDGAEERTLKTRAVLFVEQSPKGELAKCMREQLHRLGPP